MATYVPAKKNTEFIFYASVVSQADTKVMQGNPTIATGDFKVSTDGGTLNNLTTIPAVTPAGSAMIKFTLSATEMNGDNITVVGKDAAGSEWCDLVVNIQTAANQIDDIKSDTGNILTDTGTTLDNHLTDIKGTGFAKDTHSLTNIEGYADLIDDGTSGLAKIATDVAAILVDSNELQTDWTNGGRLDLIIDELTTNVDAIETDTQDLQTQIGTAGAGLTDVTGRLPSALTKGTADSGTTTTMVDAARTEADTDYWKGSWIRFTSGTISGQTRLISGFTPASDTITFTPATTQAVGTNTYEIIPAGDIDTVSTLSGHTAQTGDSFARLGAPAGASVSADIAAVKTDTGNILTDTSEIGVAGAGLTNINLPDQTMNITGNITGNLSGSVGSVTGAVGSVTAGVSVAAGGIASGSIASAELNNIADAMLDRNMSTGTDSGSASVRTVRQALRAARNRVAIAGGTATVYKEDDATTSWTAAVSTTAGNPISEVDPAGP